MRKTLLKILGTIFAVAVFLIAQYYIRQYYGIDPRIWFFVVFGISFIGLFAILVVFDFEIESIKAYFKMHSFSEFISEISSKVKPVTSKMKPIIKKMEPIAKKIVGNLIYKIITIISIITAFTGFTYKLFFQEDFMARTPLYIIFLVMIFCSMLSYLLSAIASESRKRSENFIYAGLWLGIFLMNCRIYI